MLKTFFPLTGEFQYCVRLADKGSEQAFAYEQCQKCLTLYVSPRPALENFHRYKEAPSVEFLATNFYKETSEARKNLETKG